jgi:FkbM family methyltransferase
VEESKSRSISEPPSEMTVFFSSDDTLKGPANELVIMENFPYEQYDVCVVPKLGTFYLDRIEDLIKGQLRAKIAWEPHIKALLEKMILPGTTVIDIGAHIGTHTLTMSRCVGSEGRVYAFEPQMKLYRELVMNMKINECHNVTAYRTAIGNEEGVIQMLPPYPKNEGATRIGFGGDYALIKPLDYFSLGNVSLIKIDVENFEQNVLEGAKETIMRSRPVILIEIMGNSQFAVVTGNRDEHLEGTARWISDLDYYVFPFVSKDYVAVPKEKI